jgi:urease accessory protein UreF
MKHAEFIREKDRLEQIETSTDPMTKDEKLIQNRVLIDEAYRIRDKENYIKLVRMDNEMQGHTRSDEQGDAKLQQGNALIGELMKQLRDKNKNIKQAERVIDVIEE